VVPIDELPFMKTLRTLQPQHQVVLGLRRPRDHHRVWLSINAEPIWSEGGELAGVVSTIADITENKLAKDQLARSESRFRLLFESVSYAIVIVDERGVIMMTNPAAGECFGYDAKELVGKPVATLIPSDDGGNMPSLLREAFQTPLAQGHEPGLRTEIEGRHADGSEIPLDVTLTHLAIHQHRYVLCTMKDISEDRRYIELERAHKKITDSVRYAQRIQMAQLGNYQDIVSAFKDATIFFSPKDIVSGDFYWFTKVQRLHFDEKAMRSETQTLKILVVADCTGHGVPGAFMAALGNAFLHEIVNEHHVIEPHRILSLLDQKIVSTLQNRGSVSMDDGMDMSVLVLDEQQRLLHFAGAKQIMYAVRQGAIEQYKGAPYSLGGKQLERNGQKRFLKETIAIQPGDRYYLASDGFQDQFGRESGRKYLRSNFRKLLLRLADVPMNEQAACFAEELNAWKGLQASQTDDILILGIEV
jgi:PAS domain S-box-containing protein